MIKDEDLITGSSKDWLLNLLDEERKKEVRKDVIQLSVGIEYPFSRWIRWRTRESSSSGREDHIKEALGMTQRGLFYLRNCQWFPLLCKTFSLNIVPFVYFYKTTYWMEGSEKNVTLFLFYECNIIWH